MESGQVSVGDTTCTDQQRPEKKLSGHTICWWHQVAEEESSRLEGLRLVTGTRVGW